MIRTDSLSQGLLSELLHDYYFNVTRGSILVCGCCKEGRRDSA